ncbi:hypothetical protein ACP70R_037978 [Stipagrostis hirtigluma subsp. patula]
MDSAVSSSAKDDAGDGRSEKNASSSSEAEKAAKDSAVSSSAKDDAGDGKDEAAKDCESDHANMVDSEKNENDPKDNKVADDPSSGKIEKAASAADEAPKDNKAAASAADEAEKTAKECEVDTSAADEAARKKSNKKIVIRTNPGKLIEAVKILSQNGRLKVIELGFEQLLYISLSSIEQKDIIVWLLNLCEAEESSDSVVIKIGDKILIINENVVAHIFGVPEGSGERLETLRKKEQGQIKQKVGEMLGLSAKDKISCDFLCDVMEGAQKNNDVELEVTCFFLIAFNVLLMPSTDMYLSAPQMQAAMNLEKIRQINWRKEILYHLAKGVKARKISKTETTDNIYGPVTVLLLFYLDHLKKTELQADVLVTPRICYYNSAMVSDLVNDTTDISGKGFQKLELGDATLYSLNYNECDKVKPPKTNKDIMQCRRRVNQEKDGGIKKTKGGKNTLNTSVRIPALVDFIN